MTAPSPHGGDNRIGVIYAGSAFCLWGLLPIYWRLLGDSPPIEVTVHRVVWTTIFVAAVTLARGRFRDIIAITRNRKLLATLALTSALISTNWTIFLYCVATKQLVEGSLGYYITPLISFVLGYLLFHEKVSRVRAFAIGLGVLAIAAKGYGLDHVPWIAPSMAVTFGLYGFFRKGTAVGAMDGLLIETALMFPIAVGLIGWWAITDPFPAIDRPTAALLIGTGPLTAIPLTLFAAGARRIKLSTLGFLQYLAPTINLVVAIFIFREPFTVGDGMAFACVWAALMLIALEGSGSRLYARFRNRPSPDVV